MKVKMMTLESGPNGSFQPGDEREVTEDHGRALIAGNHAVEIHARVAEHATLREPEKAVMMTAAEHDAAQRLAAILAAQATEATEATEATNKKPSGKRKAG